MKYSDLVDDEEEANIVRREIINDPRSLPAHSERCNLLSPVNDPLYTECQEIAKRESPGTSLVSEETEWMREHRLREEKRKRDHAQWMEKCVEWEKRQELIRLLIENDFDYQNAKNYAEKMEAEYNVRMRYKNICGKPDKAYFFWWKYMDEGSLWHP
jgi:hypothetical protein